VRLRVGNILQSDDDIEEIPRSGHAQEKFCYYTLAGGYQPRAEVSTARVSEE
jgi:hypothetical protein